MLRPRNRSKLALFGLLALAGCRAESPPRTAPDPVTATPSPSAEDSAWVFRGNASFPRRRARRDRSARRAQPGVFVRARRGAPGGLCRARIRAARHQLRVRKAGSTLRRQRFARRARRYSATRVSPPSKTSHAVILAALLFRDESSTKSRARPGGPQCRILPRQSSTTSTSATARLIPTAQLPRQATSALDPRRAARVLARTPGRGRAAQVLRERAPRPRRKHPRESPAHSSASCTTESRTSATRSTTLAPGSPFWSLSAPRTRRTRPRRSGFSTSSACSSSPVGEGARSERRMIIFPKVSTTSTSEQYGLLVTHLVHQEKRSARLRSPLRLQWDVLADDGGALDELLPP